MPAEDRAGIGKVAAERNVELTKWLKRTYRRLLAGGPFTRPKVFRGLYGVGDIVDVGDEIIVSRYSQSKPRR
jgi:hypothetical protein